MTTPASTYRLQLSPAFTFEDLQEIIDYLEQLQISTIYAAPLFQAKEGSTHGYDVADPLVINRAIGDIEAFRTLSQKLKRKGIGWLQDIVPNHMANHPENPWIDNVLELGPLSPYYRHFDINWQSKTGEGQVMVPILGKPLEQVLANNEVQLKFSRQGFKLEYFEHHLPVSAAAYNFILSRQKETFGLWVDKFQSSDLLVDHWKDDKSTFIQALDEDSVLSKALSSVMETFNSSVSLMKELLSKQHYELAYWKETEKRINFRRFFTINDLICLRMEEEEVFDDYHAFILQLCQEKLITGLRIDHIDGLFDPLSYLEKLREKVGKDFYLVIEKILEWEEELPTDWPIQGTSGYQFLAVLNNLFTALRNKDSFEEHYQKLHPHEQYEDLVFEKKSYILQERMAGELQNLWELILDLGLWEEGRDKQERGKQALSALLAAFPIYRIYPKAFPLTNAEQDVIDKAFQGAVQRVPELEDELSYLRELWKGNTEANKDNMLFFLQRCQQFSGPLAAKGVEDTLFYNYNFLISHNEVGDSPAIFGIAPDEFHQFMARRLATFPLALNATATHDTKRGEDARMRINVLSEIPEEWFQKVEEWHRLNQSVRKSAQVPDNNEEYFIYQMLIGAMAFEDEDEANFLERTLAYLQKVLREAKVHTFWSAPDDAYEQEVADFVTKILGSADFRRSFDPFKDKVAFYGAFYSLGQTLIKVTAPGIPDIYQGTELWELHYVDPDNRRPVDYELRKNFLSEIHSFEESTETLQKHLKTMQSTYADGKIKMYTLYKALKERKIHQELFEKGIYVKIDVSSEYTDKVISYARHYQGQWYLIAVPTGVTSLTSQGSRSLELEKKVLKGGFLRLLVDAPRQWEHVYTGEVFTAGGSEGILDLEEIFASYPVVLLKSK